MSSMPNKARNTRTSAHLDNIPVGCLIDGSHNHPDDFSTMIVRYAEMLGMPVDDSDLVYVLLRETGIGEDFPAETQGEISEHLAEYSDQAVNWLNEHVVTGDYAFHVEESSLFLSPLDEITD